jgi:hypothetical protein
VGERRVARTVARGTSLAMVTPASSKARLFEQDAKTPAMPHVRRMRAPQTPRRRIRNLLPTVFLRLTGQDLKDQTNSKTHPFNINGLQKVITMPERIPG